MEIQLPYLSSVFFLLVPEDRAECIHLLFDLLWQANRIHNKHTHAFSCTPRHTTKRSKIEFLLMIDSSRKLIPNKDSEYYTGIKFIWEMTFAIGSARRRVRRWRFEAMTRGRHFPYKPVRRIFYARMAFWFFFVFFFCDAMFANSFELEPFAIHTQTSFFSTYYFSLYLSLSCSVYGYCRKGLCLTETVFLSINIGLSGAINICSLFDISTTSMPSIHLSVGLCHTTMSLATANASRFKSLYSSHT